MVESAQSHLRTELLAHRNETDPDHGDSLVRVVLLEVVAARVQHFLYFQHVSRSCVRATLHNERRKLAVRPGQGLEGLEGELCGALLAEVEEAEAEDEEAGVRVGEGGLVALKESLQKTR
jgi:hypothetical protein